jgi:acetaldehyde/propanal dehydrogenase
MTTKAKAAIIGPGNIGTDLLMKCQRSDFIEATWMVGIEDSAGIQRARALGLRTTTEGVDGLVAGFSADPVDFVFDATSAYVHAENSRKVTALGAMMIDLTPAAIGPFCIPPVNLQALLDRGPHSKRQYGHVWRASNDSNGGSCQSRAASELRRDRCYCGVKVRRYGHAR